MVGTTVGGLNLAAFLSTQMELRKLMRHTSVKQMCSFLSPFTSLSRQTKTQSAKMQVFFTFRCLRYEYLDPEITSDPTAVKPRTHGARRSKRRLENPPVESIHCSKGGVSRQACPPIAARLSGGARLAAAGSEVTGPRGIVSSRAAVSTNISACPSRREGAETSVSPTFGTPC